MPRTLRVERREAAGRAQKDRRRRGTRTTRSGWPGRHLPLRWRCGSLRLFGNSRLPGGRTSGPGRRRKAGWMSRLPPQANPEGRDRPATIVRGSGRTVKSPRKPRTRPGGNRTGGHRSPEIPSGRMPPRGRTRPRTTGSRRVDIPSSASSPLLPAGAGRLPGERMQKLSGRSQEVGEPVPGRGNLRFQQHRPGFSRCRGKQLDRCAERDVIFHK